MAAAALASLKEAQDMLGGRGCHLNIKSIRNIVKRFAVRARFSQENGGLSIDANEVADARVVISVDGGRIRIRKNKKGKKTKKGRRRYHTDWREPKLLIIYLVDQKGRMEKKFRPIIDASLNGPDEIFTIMGAYLATLNICNACSVAFIADGARWIWTRAHKMMNALGVLVDRVHFILDFYHAIEHLSDLLELKKWPPDDRKIYVKKYRNILLKGRLEEFLSFIESITGRSRSLEVKRERNYFEKNKEKMQYGQFSLLQLPIGSGAVESAIRRVINMRLKGPGIFWHEDTANEMLMLRSYYKANRWGLLRKMALSSAMIEAPQ